MTERLVGQRQGGGREMKSKKSEGSVIEGERSWSRRVGSCTRWINGGKTIQTSDFHPIDFPFLYTPYWPL